MEIKNFTFKKKFGQNFLVNPDITEKIATVVNPIGTSLVIEIGCGDGRLTKKLCKYFDNVLCYEIDKEVAPFLNDNLKGVINYNVNYCDFLIQDINKDVNKYKYDSLYIIANLPYYITTPIIEKIIDSKIDPNAMVFMVQKEVGDRFTAKPGTKIYSSLSIYLNYYFNVKKEFIVGKNNFLPKPNVDSIVVSFRKKEKEYDVISENLFFKLVRDSFKYKRKTLRNNLREYDLNTIKEVLEKYNFDLNVRAEQMKIEIFIDIANKLSEKSI